MLVERQANVEHRAKVWTCVRTLSLSRSVSSSTLCNPGQMDLRNVALNISTVLQNLDANRMKPYALNPMGYHDRL